MNTLEEFLKHINSNTFLREFSFSQTTFNPKPGDQKELADHVLWWLGDSAIVFQLKERSSDAPMDAQALDRWFENKVLTEARKQISDTINFLKQHPKILIKNQRGHAFDLEGSRLKQITKLVVYAIPIESPAQSDRRKSFERPNSGFTHVIAASDYVGICNTLVTPSEIQEYLNFREQMLRKLPDRAHKVSEKSLAGLFLSGQEFWPEPHYESFVDSLKDEPANYSLTSFFDGIADRIINPPDRKNGSTDYYDILREFAHLNRSELRALKERLIWCKDTCRSGELHRPSPFVSPRTDCSFAFIPLPKEARGNPTLGLTNIAAAVKYDGKTTRAVGTAIAYDPPYYNMYHCLIESPWRPDPEFEQLMRDNPILRPAREDRRNRYEFE